jgi:hypothetical protein
MTLAAQIEAYLLLEARWVPAVEICQRFQVSKRKLRACRTRPGLLDDFAVSSKQGHKHTSLLTTAEYLPYKHKMLRHSISQIRKIKKWDNGRHNSLTKKPVLIERHSGQLLLP